MSEIAKDFPGVGDVFFDLVGQFRDGIEFYFFAHAVDKVDPDASVIEVLLEVEQMHLDRLPPPAERRARTDVLSRLVSELTTAGCLSYALIASLRSCPTSNS